MEVLVVGAVVFASVVGGTIVLGWLVRRLVGASISVMRTILVGVGAYFVGAPLVFLITGGTLLVDGDAAVDAQPPIADVLLVIVSMVWVLAVSASILVVLEAAWPSADGPGVIASISELSMRRRRTARYIQVVSIATRHGLRPLLNGRRARSQAGGVETAIVAALNEAGVAFVKLGQLLATRPDIVPPALATALSDLHSTAAPVPWDEITRVVEQETGRPVGRLFAWIDPEPLAAASIGQVHAARLADGREVVAKVQRPLARAQVEVDIDIANRLARRMESRSHAVRRMRLADLVQGLTDALRNELSFAAERENMLLLAAAGRRRAPVVLAPAVVSELCTERLLVVERVRGTVLSGADALLAGFPRAQRRRMARELIDEVVQQILVDGVFHADLHPGNLMVGDSGTLTLIDFGSVAIIDTEQRFLLATLLMALHAEDPSSAIVALRHLVGDAEHLDEAALRRELGALFTVAQLRTDVDSVLSALLSILWKHQLSIPSGVAAAARAVASLLHLVSLLDPSLDAIGEVTSHARLRVKRLVSGDRAVDAAWARMATLAIVARQLPARLDLFADSTAQFALDRSIHERRRPAVRRRVVMESVAAVFTIACGAAAIALVSVSGGPEVSSGVALLPLVGSALGAIAVLGALRTWVAVRHPDAPPGTSQTRPDR